MLFCGFPSAALRWPTDGSATTHERGRSRKVASPTRSLSTSALSRGVRTRISPRRVSFLHLCCDCFVLFSFLFIPPTSNYTVVFLFLLTSPLVLPTVNRSDRRSSRRSEGRLEVVSPASRQRGLKSPLTGFSSASLRLAPSSPIWPVERESESQRVRRSQATKPGFATGRTSRSSCHRPARTDLVRCARWAKSESELVGCQWRLSSQACSFSGPLSRQRGHPCRPGGQISVPNSWC